MRNFLSVFIFLIPFLLVAQKDNVFLERSFWQSHPDLETVKEKIGEGHDATALNSNGFDGTIYALLGNADNEVITYLLSLQGNEMDKRTHDSRIYLHWAAMAGNNEMVEYLLKNGSSQTVVDSHGYIPLAFAAATGQKNWEVYKTFEKYGANLAETTDAEGTNLLLLIATYLEGETELQFFTEKGLSPQTTDAHGNGLFNYAAKGGNIGFLQLLEGKGLVPKKRNAEGGNAFIFAAQGTRGKQNSIEVFNYLKNLGLEPNVVTQSGVTPLHHLSYRATDPAIFNLFLTSGANVNQKDADGDTPFLNAAARNELAVVKLLESRGGDIKSSNAKGQTALMLAVENNSPDVVEFLIEKGSDASTKDAAGNNLAYYLVSGFHPEKMDGFDMKLRILQKIRVPMDVTQADGNTLYHLAAKTNQLELVKRLSALNIPINAVNDEGMTPLHLAAMKATGDELMKYLISQGADTGAVTEFGETPFDLAQENEQLQQRQTNLSFLK